LLERVDVECRLRTTQNMRHPPRRIVGKRRDLPMGRPAMTAGNGGRNTLG
jgi:hypothetical protein